MSDTDCIQVAVRIRPLVESELTRKCASVVDKAGSGQQIICDNGGAGGKFVYSFNYVFNQLDTQESIYEACVKKMLDKLFQGYNATILAYGQTGSGKTHTMGTTFGGHFDENMGVIPRAVIDIFNKLNDIGANHNTITCSFLELYQEQLFDLLSGKSRDQSILDIRECTTKGIIVVPGLTETIVKNPEETLKCLMKGSNGRVTGATAMNSVSSRSHAIFTITLKFVCDDKVIKSKFHLVDLAGSERSNKTKAIGDRFKEGVQINKGLLALSKVIAALEKSNNGGYVGYRDSKLTRLLQDSLGGNSVTLMIACVSPANYNFEETLSTLRYADQAKKIKNKPIINLDSDSLKLNKIKQTVYALELKLHDLKNVKMLESDTDKARLRKEIDEVNSRNLFIEKETQEMLNCLVAKHDKNSSYENIFKDFEPKIEVLTAAVTELIANSGDGAPYKLEIDNILKLVKQMSSVLAEYESNQQQINLDIKTIGDHRNVALTEDEIIEDNKITEKQLEYRNQIRDIDTKIELKCQLIKKISEQKIYQMSAASNASSNNDSHGSQISLNNMTFNRSAENLIKGFEIRIKELEAQKRELVERMKTKNKFSGEEYRLKLKEMDNVMKDLRQSILTQSKTLKMKEKDPKKIKSLEMEINELRRTKQRLNACMQSDLKRFDIWKEEKNLELLKEEIRYKKTQDEVEKCNVKFDSENYELRRQIEEANERKNRLKSVLENISKNKHNANISDFIENVMNLLITSQETKASLNELMITRTSLYAKLAYMKSQVSPNKRDIANLEEDLELRNAQINDLREKILSSNVDELLAKICDRIQIMADGKIVMKYCIDLAIKLKKKLSNSVVRYEDATREEKNIRSKVEHLEHENESIVQSNSLKLKEIQMKYDDKITVLLRELNNHHNPEQLESSNFSDDLFDEIEEIRKNIDLKQKKHNCLLDQINEIKNHSRITRNSIHLLKDEETTTEDSDVISETPGSNIPKMINLRRTQRKRSIIKCRCKAGCKTNHCLCRKSNIICTGCACSGCCNNVKISKENITAKMNVPLPSKIEGEVENHSNAEKGIKRVSADDDLNKTPIKLHKFDHIEDVVTPTYPYSSKQRKAFYE